MNPIGKHKGRTQHTLSQANNETKEARGWVILIFLLDE